MLKLSFTFILFLFGCTKNNSQQASETVLQEPLAQIQPKQIDNKDFLTKEFRESTYFSASLEREALRLILKNSQFENSTLFTVLSFAIESAKGVKKTLPLNFDCGSFDIQKKQDTIQFFKTCQKPATLLAEVKIAPDQKRYVVDFKIKELGNIIGVGAALTNNSNVQCEIQVEDKKLQSFKCSNWVFQTQEATEIRLSTFLFERNNPKQMHLKGGFFKELVENKKIEIFVPITGQIKMIEKDIEVIDEFANQINDPKRLPKIDIKEPEAPTGASLDEAQSDQNNGGVPPPNQQNEIPQEAISSPETTPPPPTDNPGR